MSTPPPSVDLAPATPDAPLTPVRSAAPTSRVRVFSAATARAFPGLAVAPAVGPGPANAGDTNGPGAELPHSKQRDPFEGFYATFNALEPPYNPEVLCQILNESDALQAAIDAIVTNVTAFGVQFRPFAESIGPTEREAFEREKRRLAMWFEHAGSPGMNFTAVRGRLRYDYELFGDAYLEVLRDAKGRVAGVEHAMSRYMRKCRRDDEFVIADEWVRGEDGTYAKRKVRRRFRRYLQWVAYGRFVYFKEFGDPRPIRADTGAVDPEAKPWELANEMLCLTRYASDPSYGRPRWRGAATSVTGRAAAGSVNADVFDNKAIPPLLITVQGASLSSDAVGAIKDHFMAARGRDVWHAPLIIEAVTQGNDNPADPAGMSNAGAIPRIEVKDLSKAIASDATFMGYRLACAKDLAMAFRLPPLYLGMEGSYNFATAQAARQVAEEQVFQPERQAEDALYNATLMPELGARYTRLTTKGPPLLTEETLLKMIDVGARSGALTVATIGDLLSPMLGVELSTPEAWRKLPTLVLQSLAAKGLLPAELAATLGDVVNVGGGPKGDPAQTGTPAGDGSEANDPAATAETPAADGGAGADGAATNDDDGEATTQANGGAADLDETTIATRRSGALGA